MDRKYGQRGYMESDRSEEKEKGKGKPREKPKGAPRRMPKDTHRTMHMPGFQEVLRCSMCGVIVPPAGKILFDSTCPKCSADLRTCKNCRHFDTGTRFECTQTIEERVVRKDLRNTCTKFEAKTSVERETREAATPASVGKSSDPRSAFEALFKK